MKIDEIKADTGQATIQAMAESAVVQSRNRWIEGLIHRTPAARARAQWGVVRYWRVCRTWLVLSRRGIHSHSILAEDSSRRIEYTLSEDEKRKGKPQPPNMGI